MTPAINTNAAMVCIARLDEKAGELVLGQLSLPLQLPSYTARDTLLPGNHAIYYWDRLCSGSCQSFQLHASHWYLPQLNSW
jgi:hypothetical protein